MRTIVLRLGDKLELGEGADLLRVDAGLALEGKRFERPDLLEVRLCDAPGERGFLPMLVLRPQEPREKGVVGELVLLGVRKFVADDCRDLREV
jgi:hypothetical protein